MRIVLDLQGAQTASRFRGIGRYSLSLATALARRANGHDVWVALNDAFPETMEPLRAAFDTLVHQDRIRTFSVPTPVAGHNPGNAWRARAGESIREAFLADLAPDLVHIASLFEGWVDDAVATVAAFEHAAPAAVTLYDLIPLLNPDIYLTDPGYKAFYYRKLQSIRKAELLLAISEFCRREAVEALQIPADGIVTISSAAGPEFHAAALAPAAYAELMMRYGIKDGFLLCAPGGFDHRKNIRGLLAAFSMLPSAVRAAHPLVITTAMSGEEKQQILMQARKAGIEHDLVLTGRVSNQDLIALYRTCHLFVFPSLHEGFGLPVLEAMACGAPAVGSNTTSIPEVIGRADALFDPASPYAIAETLSRVLSDEGLRQSLRAHGPVQARRFSWEATADRALDAFAALHDRQAAAHKPVRLSAMPGARPRLAYVSPLPPTQSGIADYSAELLPALACHYDIEVVPTEAEVAEPWISANFPIRSMEWFGAHAGRYDRILYHFGNSPFHAGMFDLLSRHPGTVVLHDFFLSSLINWQEIAGGETQAFLHALYRSHGYPALIEEQVGGREAAVWTYPANLQVIADSCGVIVHSGYAVRQARLWYGPKVNQFRLIPQLHALPSPRRQEARAELGIGEQDFCMCSFGFLDFSKLNHRLLDAWLASSLAQDANCRLIFVGENQGADYGQEITRRIQESGCAARIQITGYLTPGQYAAYQAAADAAVQLRTRSRGETSRAALDCLAYGIPTIVNAHASLAELPETALVMIPDEFTDADLTDALTRLRHDHGKRAALAERARAYVATDLAPARIASAYADAIEEFAARHPHARRRRLVRSLAALEGTPEERDILASAWSIDANRAYPCRQRQLLFDVSSIARHDLKAGIERVTRAILEEGLRCLPPDWRLEPVYEDKGTYRYARRFTADLIGRHDLRLDEEVADVSTGDLFLGVDYCPDAIARSRAMLHAWHHRGLAFHFVVHDLLPVNQPEMFPPGADAIHRAWLETIAGLADGLICVSRAVAGELRSWLALNGPQRHRPLRVESFHLGTSTNGSAATGLQPEGASQVLAALRARPTFLMVGTIEPRKGHLQVIGAMERLWARGIDVNLAVVGKEGWAVLPDDQRRTIPRIMSSLRRNPELGKRLFHLEGIDDGYLDNIYAASDCLVAASEGEGFGLPLIEAARHDLPIIARDIPVFREVAGDFAFYFSGLSPDDLAQAIERWLALQRAGDAPRSSGMPWLDWPQSTRRLYDLVLGPQPERSGDSREAAAPAAEMADIDQA